MDSDLVKIAKQPDGSVLILPVGSLEDISLLPAVLAAFESELRKKHAHFLLDLSEMPQLPPSWVVLIYEMTARSRRRGGNLCVLNMGEHAASDLLNFQANDYLCLDRRDFIAPLTTPQMDQQTPIPGELFPPEAPPRSVNETDITSSVDIPSRVDLLYRACDFVLEIAEKMGFPEPELSKIKISVYEACLNAIEHAYHSDATRQVRVQVTHTAEKITIRIIDHGDGFEVKTNEDFDAVAAAAARRTGGMGLHIIRRSMDKVSYVRNRHDGNMLIMEKSLHPPKPISGGH